jgi:hypothetical protein
VVRRQDGARERPERLLALAAGQGERQQESHHGSTAGTMARLSPTAATTAMTTPIFFMTTSGEAA